MLRSFGFWVHFLRFFLRLRRFLDEKNPQQYAIVQVKDNENELEQPFVTSPAHFSIQERFRGWGSSRDFLYWAVWRLEKTNLALFFSPILTIREPHHRAGLR